MPARAGVHRTPYPVGWVVALAVCGLLNVTSDTWGPPVVNIVLLTYTGQLPSYLKKTARESVDAYDSAPPRLPPPSVEPLAPAVAVAVAANGDRFLTLPGSTAIAKDDREGNRLWTFSSGDEGELQLTAVGARGGAYVITRARLHALAADGTERWTVPVNPFARSRPGYGSTRRSSRWPSSREGI